MLDDIRKFINERVKPVDFRALLLEDGEDAPPADEPPAEEPPAEDGGFDDDLGGEDLGGGDMGGDGGDFGGGDGGDFGGGDFGGGSGGSSGEGDDETTEEDKPQGNDKYADREDDPDYQGKTIDGTPAAVAIYDMEGALEGLNTAVIADDVNLKEVEKAKTVIEVIANGKKLLPTDFEDINDNESFSDIIKRSLEKVDDKTRNYFSMKIKQALLAMQAQKKIEAGKADSEVDQIRDITDQI